MYSVFITNLLFTRILASAMWQISVHILSTCPAVHVLVSLYLLARLSLLQSLKKFISDYILSRLLVSLYLLGCSFLSISTCLTVSLFGNL